MARKSSVGVFAFPPMSTTPSFTERTRMRLPLSVSSALIASSTCALIRESDCRTTSRARAGARTARTAASTAPVSHDAARMLVPITGRARPARWRLEPVTRGAHGPPWGTGARSGPRRRWDEGRQRRPSYPVKSEQRRPVPVTRPMYGLHGAACVAGCVAPPRNSANYSSSSRLASAAEPPPALATDFGSGTLGCPAVPQGRRATSWTTRSVPSASAAARASRSRTSWAQRGSRRRRARRRSRAATTWAERSGASAVRSRSATSTKPKRSSAAIRSAAVAGVQPGMAAARTASGQTRSWMATVPPRRSTRCASRRAAVGSGRRGSASRIQTCVKCAARKGRAAGSAGTRRTCTESPARRVSASPASASARLAAVPTTSHPRRAASQREVPPRPASRSRTSSYLRKMPRAASASRRWKPVPLARSSPRYGRPRGAGAVALCARTRVSIAAASRATGASGMAGRLAQIWPRRCARGKLASHVLADPPIRPPGPRPAWYRRLPASLKRVAAASDRVPTLPLRAGAALKGAVAALPAVLATGRERDVQALAQRISDDICAAFRVPGVRVRVAARRPPLRGGELQGLYTPADGRGRDLITVWMLTAKRGQVVAFRTFLRTLLHELCHHLDYTLLHLRDSLHTQGFYQRESSLFRALEAGSVDAER